MKSVLLFLFFLVGLIRVTGQDRDKKPVIIKAESRIMDVLSREDVFSYPVFTTGKVYFKGGAITEVKLNYNKLVDEMHFIAPKGDTLAVTDEKMIKHIVIGKDTFYYDNGYVRLLLGGNVLRLALKQTWRISDTRRIGAFNTNNSHSAITPYINYSDATRMYDLVVNEDLVLSRVKAYFLGDMNGHFLPANKKNLVTLMPKVEKHINLYLKENKIDFNNREDLQKMIRYLENQ